MKPIFDPDVTTLQMVALGGAFLVLGAVLGLVYFAGVYATAKRMARGAPGLPTFGLVAARLVLMVGGLFFAALQGAVPLIATAVGILAGRFAVMRYTREQAG